MIPTMKHSGEGDGDSKKISNAQRLVGREGWTDGAQRILGQWNYAVRYYNGEYISLYICQNTKREP